MATFCSFLNHIIIIIIIIIKKDVGLVFWRSWVLKMLLARGGRNKDGRSMG